MFLNYDLLAQRYVPYSYVYPYAETAAAVDAGWYTDLGSMRRWRAPSAPWARYQSSKRFTSISANSSSLRGGNSNVPLGFVSLTENLVTIGMGLYRCALLASTIKSGLAAPTPRPANRP